MHPEIAKNHSNKNLQPQKRCPDCNSREMKFWKGIEDIGDGVGYWYCPNCGKYEPETEKHEQIRGVES